MDNEMGVAKEGGGGGGWWQQWWQQLEPVLSGMDQVMYGSTFTSLHVPIHCALKPCLLSATLACTQFDRGFNDATIPSGDEFYNITRSDALAALGTSGVR